MTPRYMLDTNICLLCRRGGVTFAELDHGVVCSGERQGQNRDALAALAADIPVAPFDAASAKAYGAVRLATRERKRDALDKLIAAHAIALGVTLVTNNTADFSGYPGLAMENWVAPT